MGRTFLRQDAQIRNSVTYTDNIAAGQANLETPSTNIEFDLNAVRSQLNRIMDTTIAGKWYDNVALIGGVRRGLSQLGTDLLDIEQKKFLIRTTVLTDVSVTAAQNWELLNVAASEAPTRVAAVAATVQGAVVAQSALSGAGFDVHELIEVAGVNAINPKNLLIIRDATTGQVIQSSGRDVFGLLQYESTGVDGAAFNDVSGGNRVKISFVRQTAGLDDLEACPVADIAGKTINYMYRDRYYLDLIPEQAFASDFSFVDQTASTDVTLDHAIDNQSGPATQQQNIDWRIDDTFTLDFQDSTGAVNLLRIMPNVAGDEIELNIDTLDINNANTADFLNGAAFDSGSQAINVGVTQGQIDSAGKLTITSTGAGNDLALESADELQFKDGYWSASTYDVPLRLSDSSAEWDAFETAFGGEVSLLAAITSAKTSSSRSKTVAVVTSNVLADTNVSGATAPINLDATLGNYTGKNFVTDVDVFLNGQLLRNGADAAANHDVYPGTTIANGDLKFEFGLQASPGNPDVITMIIY